MTQTTLPASLSTSGWQLSDQGTSIKKTFRFKNFRAAMAFMVEASFEAEAINHHPDWFNCYNRVEVTLTTHDSHSLTDKDITLATAMDMIAHP